MIDEENYPYFDDDYLWEKIDQMEAEGVTIESIAKELCLIKSGIEEMKIGDITIPSPRKYFLALASGFRNNKTGTVVRADGR